MSRPRRPRRKPLPRLKARPAPRRYEFSTYEAMVAFLIEQPAQAWHALVLHDDGCPGFAACHCRPDYVVEELTTDNYLRGQRLQAELVRGHSN